MILKVPWFKFVCILVSLYCGTTTSAQRLTLRFSEIIDVPEQHDAMIFAPIKCGVDGHLFIRFADGGQGSSINIISNDAKRISWASPSSVTDVKDSHLEDFAPGPNGELYLLLSRETKSLGEEEFIAKFDSGGTYVSATKLNIDFHARRLAIFSLIDEFVVTGYRMRDTAKPDVPVAPLTALFDSAGQLLRYINLPRDIESDTEVKHFHAGSSKTALTQHAAIDLSSLQATNDGNIYLMRATPAGPVYSISAGGAVHRITLTPPDKWATLLSIKVDGGRVVAEYNSHRVNEHTIRVLEVFDQEGNLRQRYEMPAREAGLGLACFHNNNFSFLLGKQDGTIQLRRGTVPN